MSPVWVVEVRRCVGVSDDRGCPVCEWDGRVAETHDADHRYYTHVIIKDGEYFEGRTCSERTRPRKPSLLERLLGGGSE